MVNTNCEAEKAIPPEAIIRRALKLSWMPLHSRSVPPKAPVTGTTAWQLAQVSWITSTNRQAVWNSVLARWSARIEPYPCCRIFK